MTSLTPYTTVALISLDGVGIAPEGDRNVITPDHLPFLDGILHGAAPCFPLDASGNALGGKTGAPPAPSQSYTAMGTGRTTPTDDEQEAVAHYLVEAGKKQLYVASTREFSEITHHFMGNQVLSDPLITQRMLQLPHTKHDATHSNTKNLEAVSQVIQSISSGRHQFAATVLQLSNQSKEITSAEGRYQLDNALEKLTNAIKETGGLVIITSAYGGLEECKLEEGGECEPTTNRVFASLIAHNLPETDPAQSRDHETAGTLARIAPTILDAFALPVPDSMEEQSLLREFTTT